jgi:uncharacterized protein (DUF2237 family)
VTSASGSRYREMNSRAMMGSVAERNVLGAELEPCGVDPVTGFFRDGCCRTGPDDLVRQPHSVIEVGVS